jgi:hypothetical protein
MRASLVGDPILVVDHFIPMLALSGRQRPLPRDVSLQRYGRIIADVHIAICRSRRTMGFPRKALESDWVSERRVDPALSILE